jgi:hypothetical protein
MTKTKMYRYIGYNGVITSPILLEDAKHRVLYELRAEHGKLLTNGEKELYVVLVEEEDIKNWHEV